MFNRSKQKLDSKVRFQHRTFTEKLKAAQNYKRTARSLPETEQEKMLAGLGLDSWWSRIIVGTGIVVLLYLVYVPNFLFVKKIEVHGANQAEAATLTRLVEQYFKESPIYAPQRNVVLLNTEQLNQFLLEHNPQLKEVLKVTRDLGSLTFAVEMKKERFELVTPSRTVALFNDGVVSRDLINEPFENKQHLIKIETFAKDEPRHGQPYFSENIAKGLLLVHQIFPPNKNYQISHFELPLTKFSKAESNPELETEISQKALEESPLAVLVPNEFVAHVIPVENANIRPFKVLFDATVDIEVVMNQFLALLLRLSPQQISNLAYIDMRFADRGFVCQASAQCAVVPEPTQRPLPDDTEPIDSVETSTEAVN